MGSRAPGVPRNQSTSSSPRTETTRSSRPSPSASAGVIVPPVAVPKVRSLDGGANCPDSKVRTSTQPPEKDARTRSGSPSPSTSAPSIISSAPGISKLGSGVAKSPAPRFSKVMTWPAPVAATRRSRSPSSSRSNAAEARAPSARRVISWSGPKAPAPSPGLHPTCSVKQATTRSGWPSASRSSSCWSSTLHPGAVVKGRGWGANPTARVSSQWGAPLAAENRRSGSPSPSTSPVVRAEGSMVRSMASVTEAANAPLLLPR